MKNTNEAAQDFSHAVKPSAIVVYEDDRDRDHIRIENLNIHLPGQARPLISNVNLTIPRVARVLVTGASGSGKTTLVKVMLDLLNAGSGRVAIPAGLSKMGIPQAVYLPNLPLRSILNMKPAGQEIYSDRALRDVLQRVNLGKLVQHIPGQQIEILMDDVVDAIRVGLDAGTALPELRAGLDDVIAKRAREQFEVVQYAGDEQRASFKDKLRQLAASRPQDQAPVPESWGDELADMIDLRLAEPLRAALEKAAEGFADEARQGTLLPYGPARAASYAGSLRRNMTRRMYRYIANEDTEDPTREVRLNKRQAEYVTAAFAAAVERALQAPQQKSVMRHVFNAISLPMRLPRRLLAGTPVAEPQMKGLMYNVAGFMEAQIVRGERLAGQLSGGQKKMLMAACVLLAKPDILLLDEIPSGLDAATGLQVYKDIMDEIAADATVISVIHHEEQFVPFHTLHLRVADGTVRMTPITPAAPAAGNGPAPR